MVGCERCFRSPCEILRIIRTRGAAGRTTVIMKLDMTGLLHDCATKEQKTNWGFLITRFLEKDPRKRIEVVPSKEVLRALLPEDVRG